MLFNLSYYLNELIGSLLIFQMRHWIKVNNFNQKYRDNRHKNESTNEGAK